jgi:hypothetical protein
MADLFGYNNNVRLSGDIASSDFAIVSVGEGGRKAMVQDCRVTYQQQIEEVTQVGDSSVYWMMGRPQGRVSVSSLVGSGGFFSGWKGECGKIGTGSVNITGGQCGFNGSGRLAFSAGVVESLNAQVTTGRQTISQGAEIRTGSMRGS